jgi:hypothetical protein
MSQGKEVDEQMCCPILDGHLFPASFTEMESHELRIREVGGLSILVHKNKIVNPLAEKFANKYLPRFIESSEVRSTILAEIKCYYQNIPNSIIY